MERTLGNHLVCGGVRHVALTGTPGAETLCAATSPLFHQLTKLPLPLPMLLLPLHTSNQQTHPPPPLATKTLLFHGTHQETLHRIVLQGFDDSLGRGNLYGRDVNSTPDTCKAAQYSGQGHRDYIIHEQVTLMNRRFRSRIRRMDCRIATTAALPSRCLLRTRRRFGHVRTCRRARFTWSCNWLPWR